MALEATRETLGRENRERFGDRVGVGAGTELLSKLRFGARRVARERGARGVEDGRFREDRRCFRDGVSCG